MEKITEGERKRQCREKGRVTEKGRVKRERGDKGRKEGEAEGEEKGERE